MIVVSEDGLGRDGREVSLVSDWKLERALAWQWCNVAGNGKEREARGRQARERRRDRLGCHRTRRKGKGTGEPRREE